MRLCFIYQYRRTYRSWALGSQYTGCSFLSYLYLSVWKSLPIHFSTMRIRISLSTWSPRCILAEQPSYQLQGGIHWNMACLGAACVLTSLLSGPPFNAFYWTHWCHRGQGAYLWHRTLPPVLDWKYVSAHYIFIGALTYLRKFFALCLLVQLLISK